VNARWLCGLLLLATTAFACKKVNPGYCDTDQDCGGVHNSCDMTTHRCPADAGTGGTGGIGGNGGKGGVGGAAGSHAGTGGTTCTPDKCSGSTPFCDMDAGACRGCESAPTNPCKSLDDGGAPVCVTATDAGLGAMQGMCVRCLTNSDCTAPNPVCVTAGDVGSSPTKHTCVDCLTNNDCSDPTPVCVTTVDAGASAMKNTCVGCLSNPDCKGTTPICNLASHACIHCGQDSDCANVGPSICMTDGHCATTAETIYVQNNTATCANTSTAGTSTQPFCMMEPVAAALSSSRDLVLVDGTSGIVTAGSWTYANQVQTGQLSIVGQHNAKIGSVSSPAFGMKQGTVYIRSVIFTSISSVGISATAGTLDLERVTVTACGGGGILIDGASFDIENTTITNNSAAFFNGTTSWSGILVNSHPDGGVSSLGFVTITNNMSFGLVCGGPISGSDVFANGNSGSLQIAPSCTITSCPNLSSSCGAQP
jgi:hypothetical protein